MASKSILERLWRVVCYSRRVPLFFCHPPPLPQRSRRRRAALFAIILVSVGSGSALVSSPHRRSEIAYAHAENIHHRISEKPLTARTREDYERTLNAYRAVYHGDPASPDAPRSIAAVADLLAEEGRCFHDAKLSRDAIAQWKFLRREYPASARRMSPRLEQRNIKSDDPHSRVIAEKSVQPEPTPAARFRAAYIQTARTRTHQNVPIAKIQAVRYWANQGSTRISVDMDRLVTYRAYLAPDGKQITLIFFGAHASEHLIRDSTLVVNDDNLRSIEAGVLTRDQAELVLRLKHPATFTSFILSNPSRLILDLRRSRTGSSVAAIAVARNSRTEQRKVIPAKEGITQPTAETYRAANFPAEPATFAPPTADGQRSMARVLGLRVRRIVIDAGHGGHDSGTLAPDGLEEKDVALDVALRLGHLLHRQLGADVIFTRTTDTFIPLEERTAIANRAHADLFLSIHANSSPDPSVRGVETYFLNFTASPDALKVAARENAISNRSVHELSGLVRTIALSDKIDESREFAANVQQSLYTGLAPGNERLKNRGVKQAPFVVLIGANMPSILAEISFLTNPDDASELEQPAYRERLAEALFTGVAQYVNGMSGVRVAKTAPPAPPQSTAE